MIRFVSRLAAAAAGFALLAAGPALAQDGEREFCADRPGKGAPTCTLEPGRFQAEGGVAWGHDDHGAVETWETDYGALTLRWGLTERMEGQLLWSPHVVVREKIGGVTSEESGSGDLGLSLRHVLTDPDGAPRSAALQLIVTAPTGADGLSAEAWEGAILLPVAFEVGESAAVTAMIELDIVGNAAGDGHHAAWAGVIGVERGFGELTLAAELWARRDDDPLGETTEATAGLQVMWTPSGLDGVQFDIGVDFGLNADAPDLEIGAGIARRF